MQQETEYLIIGSGLAGLASALELADALLEKFGQGSPEKCVTIIAKKQAMMTNTSWAQGGIAAVTADDDTFESHIRDTLYAGAGLCNLEAVQTVVSEAPARIDELEKWGVRFDLQKDHQHEDDSLDKALNEKTHKEQLDLTREGGHSKRRILHVQDHTGRAIQDTLLSKVKAHPRIRVLENHMAIDLLIDSKIDPRRIGQKQCIGAYIFNIESDEIFPLKARATLLATGGAGKIYLYTSNWDGATGDGIAMAYRAGARVANMEFMQFHPTCLYSVSERSFLITEALRGEGAELINSQGEAFMKRYHPMGSLAPRDIVARSIDAEMKRTGAESVFLDITSKPKSFLMSHFPVIYEKCAALGIDMATQPIPVVPAAHYLCGGVLVDLNARTDIKGLFTIGESACTGLHGANRLASNSLLECVVFAHRAAQFILNHEAEFPMSELNPPNWNRTGKQNADEMVMISHMWDEIRRLMWNYVGIVRTNRRLERAQNRLRILLDEIHTYYWDMKVHPDVLELRNLALVAHLTVECALQRYESRGINYNLDYPGLDESHPPMDTVASAESLSR